jgi:hypothetical protein
MEVCPVLTAQGRSGGRATECIFSTTLPTFPEA